MSNFLSMEEESGEVPPEDIIPDMHSDFNDTSIFSTNITTKNDTDILIDTKFNSTVAEVEYTSITTIEANITTSETTHTTQVSSTSHVPIIKSTQTTTTLKGPSSVLPLNTTEALPPYDINTSKSPKFNETTTQQVVDDQGLGTKKIAILAGSGAGALLVILLIIVIICLVLKRKKNSKKRKNITMIENPRYRPSNHAYRFSADSSHLANPRSKQKNNNIYDSPIYIRKKAPEPPTNGSTSHYAVSKPFYDEDLSNDAKDKRRAPPPPNPFTGELDVDSPYRPLRKSSEDLYDKVDNEAVPLTTFGQPTTFRGDSVDEEEDEFDRTGDEEDFGRFSKSEIDDKQYGDDVFKGRGDNPGRDDSKSEDRTRNASDVANRHSTGSSDDDGNNPFSTHD